MRKPARVWALVGVRADSPAAGGELGGILQERVVDADTARLGTGEKGVDAQGGQRAAGVFAEGELRVGTGREMVSVPLETWADKPLTPLISAARLLSVVSCPAPSRVTGMLFVVLAPVCVFVAMIWNEPLVGVKGRPAWEEFKRNVGIADRVEARGLRVGRRPLAAGIDLVEFVGQRGGEGIQLVLKPAEHVVTRADQPLQFAGTGLQGRVGSLRSRAWRL